MKTTSWGIMTAAMLLTACAVGPASAGDDAAPAAPPATNVVIRQTMCPVMGGAVNRTVFADYQGMRVYFCCNACTAPFKKDPTKYIKKMEAEGITLDRVPPPATTNAPAASARQP
jgi:YHS domain-containing protein